MKPIYTGLVGAAFLALTGVAAQADCAADLAAMTGGDHGGGISKDGSLAPLEGADSTTSGTAANDATASTGAAADSGTAADTDSAAAGDSTAGASGATSGAASTDTAAAGDGGGIAKDGTHTPLEGADGQQPGVAMSGADAQAQQEGKPTASEQAAGSAGGSDRDMHIEQARAALAAGDEAACMKHLEEAKAAS
ncbi:hypothetical protein [Paracoccus sp. SSK6]|uniref:hypothetical protein n=1 Tax=Paracoccus sp. SSK6 TaxID=3143131 RepID=UPI00321A55AF